MTYFKPILLIVLGAILGTAGIAYAASSVIWPYQGGTGTTTPPTYGKVLVGNAGGTYTLTATSSLGISSSGGTVTSVGITGNNGISVSGSPITSSGSITLGLSSLANSVLANSTISGVSLGSTLAALTAGAGLTSAGTYTGATARTFSLDLAHANTWTALQTFGNASTTQLSAASQKFYVDSTGKITGYDTTYSLSGTVSPMRFLPVQLATTTAWTGTTTSVYTAHFEAPFTGTVQRLACYTDAGTLTMKLTDGATSVYLAGASTTNNTNVVSLSITKGDKLTLDGGNPASTPTWVSCTLGATQS